MSPRPNVVLVVADQHRWDWLSCAGTVGPDTPVLDSLAARGTRFTRATTTSALCVPARIGLASGLLPHRVGALTNNAYLPARVPTWYQRLRDADYRVGLVGKVDLAKPAHHNGLAGDRPSAYRWGFTHPVEVEGKMHAGTSPTPIGPYTSWLAEQGLLDRFHADYMDRLGHIYSARRGDGIYRSSVLPEEAFADAWIGRRAARWVEEVTHDHPWFLQVGFAGPHDPYDPPPSRSERYSRSEMADPAPSGDREPLRVRHLRFRCDPSEVRVARQQYTAALSVIDAEVGRLLDALDATGQADRTIVVFTADHGDMLGDRGLFQKGVAYEAAMRIPLIVAGPEAARGALSDALVELPDVGETILGLAGVRAGPDVDARSFAHLLAEPSASHRTDQVCLEEAYSALRTETHKLIVTHSQGEELYDLVEDPWETRNVAHEQQEVCHVLRTRLRGRLQEGAWSR